MIRHLQIEQNQDFIVPLDCDEFLAVEGENDETIAFDRETFEERLRVKSSIWIFQDTAALLQPTQQPKPIPSIILQKSISLARQS